MRNHNFFALLAVLLLCTVPALSQAVDVSVSVNFAPPEIPVYEQPPLPAPGYLFVPGYWAWDGTDYYWVPGTWVEPPVGGMLWTPGYWDYQDGAYFWTDGYWGPDVGFYGGVNYGFGYTGVGYQGGYWHGGAFFYNRAVVNFGSVNVVNVYRSPVRIHESSRISFRGGQGGLRTAPSVEERRAMGERHRAPTGIQMQHAQYARTMPELHAKQNGGRPPILTTQHAGDFTHPGPGAGLHNHQQPGPQQRLGPTPEARQPAQPREQTQQREQIQQRDQAQQREQVQQRDQAQQREQTQQRDQAQQREQAQQRDQAQQREQTQQRAEAQQQQRPSMQQREQPQQRDQVQRQPAPPREQVQQHEPVPQHEPVQRAPVPAARPEQARPPQPRPQDHAEPKRESDDRKDR